MTREEIVDKFGAEELLFADGFDDAIVGVSWDISNSNYRIVYNSEKCITILMEHDHMSFEDAREFFDFNTLQAYVGSNTPIFMEPIYG